MRHIDETACGGRKSTSGQPFLLASLFNGYFLPSLNDNIIHCEIGEFEPISTDRYLDRFFDDNIPSTHLLTSLLIENVHVILGFRYRNPTDQSIDVNNLILSPSYFNTLDLKVREL